MQEARDPADSRTRPRTWTEDVTALILAGGLGMRLRLALGDGPKVLAPVRGRPFIHYLLEQLARAGLQRVVMLTGYRADQVEKTLGPSQAGLRLSYACEPRPLGTAGALRAALPHITTPQALLLNGDSYCGVDLAALAKFHCCRRSDASLALARVDDAGRFGRVRTTSHGRITGFVEKQSGGPGWINAGVYLLQRLLIEALPARAPLSLERDVLPEWLPARRVFGFACSQRFLDIGTPDSYAAAGDFFGERCPALASA